MNGEANDQNNDSEGNDTSATALGVKLRNLISQRVAEEIRDPGSEVGRALREVIAEVLRQEK